MKKIIGGFNEYSVILGSAHINFVAVNVPDLLTIVNDLLERQCSFCFNDSVTVTGEIICFVFSEIGKARIKIKMDSINESIKNLVKVPGVSLVITPDKENFSKKVDSQFYSKIMICIDEMVKHMSISTREEFFELFYEASGTNIIINEGMLHTSAENLFYHMKKFAEEYLPHLDLDTFSHLNYTSSFINNRALEGKCVVCENKATQTKGSYPLCDKHTVLYMQNPKKFKKNHFLE